MARDNRLLLVLGCLAVLDCGSGSGSTPAAVEAKPANQSGFTIALAGETRQLDSATFRLCSEGLPEDVELTVTTTDARCPELFAQGPAGAPRPRGRVCEQLHVRARGFELGVAIAARGSSSALVEYSSFASPAVFLSSGDSGPSDKPQGSITIEELRRLPDGRYRVRFEVSLSAEPALSATGAATVAPAFCTGA